MDIIYVVLALLTDTSVLFGFFILTLYVVFRHVFIDRSNGLPPGPRFRLPLIGNMYDVDQDMRKFLRKYRHKYGDVYSLYFGNELTIVIAGYDKLKEAFVKNGEAFSERPKGRNIINDITKGKGIIFVGGELWKEHRKFSLTTLRSFGMGRSIAEQIIHSEAETLLKIFSFKQEEAFDPRNTLNVCVSNVMNALSFGGHFQHDDPRYKEMMEKVNVNFSNLALSGISSFVPALAYLPGDIFKIKQTLENAEDIYGFLQEFATEHLQNYNETKIEDFTAAFIHEMKKQECSKETSTFTMDQLVYLLGDFFAAGIETTSGLMMWAMAYLVNFPDIQEQMFNGIKEEIGTYRLPGVQDKTKIPLVDAFLRECLRHGDLTFTALPHATSRDVVFNGYLIPKGATVIGDLDSVNQDRELWNDPEEFRPQRFIDETGSLTIPEQFVPFSLGRRSCLGESLAKMEMFLLLSAIVQNFKISAPPGEDLNLGTLDSFGMTHVPRHYKIIATPRGQSLPLQRRCEL